MSRPAAREAVDEFMAITGAPEALARRRLEEHGGDLDLAVNAHFGELERNVVNPMPAVSNSTVWYNNNNGGDVCSSRVEAGGQRQGGGGEVGGGGILPFLSAARSFRPSLLLDPNYRRNLLNQMGAVAPFSTPSWGLNYNGGYVQQQQQQQQQGGYQSGPPPPRPVIGGETGYPVSYGSQLNFNNAEEDMMRHAVETSRREWLMRDSSVLGPAQGQPHLEDDELARALSLSLKTAEEEKAMREQVVKDQNQERGVSHSSRRADKVNDGRSKTVSSSLKDGGKDMQEQPLISEGTPTQNAPHMTQQLIQEQQGLERLLAAKEASLPQEPAADDENAVMLVVRMPDGSRRGRRFLKSNKLLCLFDFIDVGGAVTPGTYRVVRPIPRRAFSIEDSSLSLNDLGFTNRQEALFLEMI